MNLMERRREMMSKRVNIQVTCTQGFISNSNLNNDVAGWFKTFTTPLQVKAGDYIVFSCYGGAANAVIYKILADNTFQMQVKGGGSTRYDTYTWTADEDCFIGFSARKGDNAPIATINGNNVEFLGYNEI